MRLFNLCKKNFKNYFYKALPVLSLFGCKAKNGNDDPPHRVSITSLTCGSNIAVELKNNSSLTAILGGGIGANSGHGYTIGTITAGLTCVIAASASNPNPSISLNNTIISIPPYGTGTASLSCVGGSPFIPCPTGAYVVCTVSPFSKENGWYEMTAQTFGC